MKRFKRGLKWLVVCAVIAGIATYGYRMYSERKEESQKTTYITEPVVRGPVQQSVLATGSVEAKKVVKVGAQVSGEISALHVKIGDRVKKGDIIAEIDARLQQNRRSTAQASLSSARAQLTSAQANLKKAEVNAARVERLFKVGAASEREWQDVQANLATSKSAVDQSLADIATRRIDLENASVNLGYTNVTSPIDGVVISVSVEQGNTVNAVQSSPTLVTLAQMNPILIKAEVSEADVQKVKVGMPTTFSLLGSDREFNSVITSIDPAPLSVSDGKTSNDTAVYYYAAIESENKDEEIRIGMTAKCTIVIQARENAVLVPMSAVRDSQENQELTTGGKESSDGKNSKKSEPAKKAKPSKGPNGERIAWVDVMIDGAPQPREVTIGIHDGVHAEVLKGLKEGDILVVGSMTAEQRAKMKKDYRMGPM